MNFNEFEQILTPVRITRYKAAVNNDRQKTMQLYRYNIYLSQKLFGIIGVFEIALRNKIDEHYKLHFNQTDWLYQQSLKGMAFDQTRTATIIQAEYGKLINKNRYTHDRLVSEMTFGFWTTLFDRPQFRAGGLTLHTIFTNRPVGTNQRFLNQNLDKVRKLRNRIAHHQPICLNRTNSIDLADIQLIYQLIHDFTNWLGYGNANLYHGIDHVNEVINKINRL